MICLPFDIEERFHSHLATADGPRQYKIEAWVNQWLWEHLVELGFRYDSSLFPFKTFLYGSFENPRKPFKVNDSLVEIPPAVSKFGSVRVPCGGGFYFMLYPYWLTQALLNKEIRDNVVPVTYFHPWEFLPEQESLEDGLINRFISGYNIKYNWSKFARLIGDYESMTMLELCELTS